MLAELEDNIFERDVTYGIIMANADDNIGVTETTCGQSIENDANDNDTDNVEASGDASEGHSRGTSADVGFPDAEITEVSVMGDIVHDAEVAESDGSDVRRPTQPRLSAYAPGQGGCSE